MSGALRNREDSTGSGNTQGTSSNIETRCDISRSSPNKEKSNDQNYLVIVALAIMAVLCIAINAGMFISYRMDLAKMQGQIDNQGKKTVVLGTENNIDLKTAQAQLEALRMELNENSKKINGFRNDLNNLASSLDQKLKNIGVDSRRNNKSQENKSNHYTAKDNVNKNIEADSEEQSKMETYGQFCGRVVLSVALNVAIFCGFWLLFRKSLKAIHLFLSNGSYLSSDAKGVYFCFSIILSLSLFFMFPVLRIWIK